MTVLECWRYPVKSLQGSRHDDLQIGPSGVDGDRERAFVDLDAGRLLSAKRVKALLDASASSTGVRLPDDTEWSYGDPGLDEAASEWLGRRVRLRRPAATETLSYEMTFDPPDDEAEYVDIPAPTGAFVDLAHLHLIAASTLEHCGRARPDQNWDVRRFRPNLVVDLGDEIFAENAWVGRTMALGATCTIRIEQPTVRCAMPLRAQPGGPEGPPLDRTPSLTSILDELNPSMPNHLGVYASVITPGTVRVGDAVTLLD